MDAKAFLNYCADHYSAIAGTLVGLSLTAGMVVLIREIGKKDDEGSGGAVDLKAIEGAMKRVLSTQPVSLVANSGLALPPGEIEAVATSTEAEAAPYDPEAESDHQLALRQCDERIEQLTSELEAAKDLAGAGGEDPATIAAKEEAKTLKTKLDELQGRLSEYEIIEDDIADLSMFKDENAKMKAEIARLKADLAKAAAAPAPAAPAALSVAASTEVVPENLTETSSAAPVLEDPTEPMKFEKTEKFELDINDDIMKEFAAAVQDQRAPAPPAAASVPPNLMPSEEILNQDPQAAINALLNADIVIPPAPIQRPQDAIDALLNSDSKPAQKAEADPFGVMDTDKVLSEATALNVDDHSLSGDSLEESLDTEKLLAEVDSLKAGSADSSATNLEDDLVKQFNKAQGS